MTVKLEEAQARVDFAEKSVNNLQKALHRLESVQALKMGTDQQAAIMETIRKKGQTVRRCEYSLVLVMVRTTKP